MSIAARLGERRWLAGILAGGLALRLALFWTDPYYADFRRFGRWAKHLVDEPLFSFYATSHSDHLPADLWILWYVGNFLHTLSPSFPVGLEHPAFLYLVKLVPTVADLGIGVMAFLIARRIRPSAALPAAALFVLNPGVIFVSSVWGQWDSVSCFFAMTSFWLLLRGQIFWSLPCLAYAALVKPQFIALVPLFAITFLSLRALTAAQRAPTPAHPPPWPARRWVPRAVGGLVAAAALTVALLVPFNVGVGPIKAATSLSDRIDVAFQLYHRPTVSAFNGWTLWTAPYHGRTDLQLHTLGLSYRTLGSLMALALCLVVYALYWRRRGSPVAFMWAAVAVFVVLFLLPTRVHERYLFPVFAFGAPLAVLHRPSRWLYAGLSVTWFVNLLQVYVFQIEHRHANLLTLDGMRVVAAVNLGLLLYALLRPPPGPERPVVRPSPAEA